MVRHFAIEGEFLDAAPYGHGHIHDTFLARFRRAGFEQRVIFQRLNDRVFADPLQVMDNVARVTAHLQKRLAATPGADPAREALSLVPARDGTFCVRDAGGRWWRAYRFIEGAVTHEVCAARDQAYEAARVVGRFQRLLADLPGPRLHETIPYFHHTPRRLQALEAAVAAADANRRRAADPDIAFARTRLALAPLIAGPLESGEIPERVTHGDTKLNNVLFDAQTGRGLCLVDLDTCMPGAALYDFGDMVRTMTCPAAEDEPDLSKVRMDMGRFEAIVRGYLEAAGGLLTRREVELLPVAGRVLTFTIGIRFLTDYLSGDMYFKVGRAGHNLDRCRTQFTLVESLENQEEEMAAAVSRAAA
ncbi:MAG: aminoglycoside phosphotransferase family protein [Verrucomicrobiota bacterium]